MVERRRCQRDLPEVPAARRFVSEAVARAGYVASDDALLVTSELVTNAVRYGSGAMELRVSVRPGFVRIEVLDEGSARIPEPPRSPPIDALGGRGLHLVRSVSDRWGSGLDADGRTLVWAELPVRRDADAAAGAAC